MKHAHTAQPSPAAFAQRIKAETPKVQGQESLFVWKPPRPALSLCPFWFLPDSVTIKDYSLCGSTSQKGLLAAKDTDWKL